MRSFLAISSLALASATTLDDRVILTIKNAAVATAAADGGKMAAIAAFQQAPESVKAIAEELNECMYGTRAASEGSTAHLKNVGMTIVTNLPQNCGLFASEVCEKFRLMAEADPSLSIKCEAPQVVRAYENIIEPVFGPTDTPSMPLNDPRLSEQWAMRVAGFNEAVFTDADKFNGSDDIVVAVIDTGIDYNHEDLKNHMWINPEENCDHLKDSTLAAAVEDKDDNGIVGDCYGANFENANSPTNDPWDDNQHGTHCAGVIGAEQNNNIGIAGVNKNVKLMALKFLSASGSGSLDGAVRCIEYAIEKKVQFMSNSWGGGGFSQSLKDAIQAAADQGIIFIAAAGNDSKDLDSTSGWFGGPSYPCSYDVENMLCVAATTESEGLASYSNYGSSSVHVSAPGSSIMSTVPNNRYASLSGTSMATPLVAGLCALVSNELKSSNYLDVKQFLMDTSKELSALNGKVVTNGRVDAVNVVNEIYQREAGVVP